MTVAWKCWGDGSWATDGTDRDAPGQGLELAQSKLFLLLLAGEEVSVGAGNIRSSTGTAAVHWVAEDGDGGIHEHAEETGGTVCVRVCVCDVRGGVFVIHYLSSSGIMIYTAVEQSIHY